MECQVVVCWVDLVCCCFFFLVVYVVDLMNYLDYGCCLIFCCWCWVVFVVGWDFVFLVVIVIFVENYCLFGFLNVVVVIEFVFLVVDLVFFFVGFVEFVFGFVFVVGWVFDILVGQGCLEY